MTFCQEYTKAVCKVENMSIVNNCWRNQSCTATTPFAFNYKNSLYKFQYKKVLKNYYYDLHTDHEHQHEDITK